MANNAEKTSLQNTNKKRKNTWKDTKKLIQQFSEENKKKKQ